MALPGVIGAGIGYLVAGALGAGIGFWVGGFGYFLFSFSPWSGR